MSAAHDATLVKSIHDVLLQGRLVATGVVHPSPFTQWVQSYARVVDSEELAILAFDMLVETVRKKEPLTVKPRPLTAAYHLLALTTPLPTSDRDLVEDTGLTLAAVKAKNKQDRIQSTDPRTSLVLRQQIAAVASEYGTSRSILTREKPRALEVAVAVTKAMEHLLDERYGPPLPVKADGANVEDADISDEPAMEAILDGENRTAPSGGDSAAMARTPRPPRLRRGQVRGVGPLLVTVAFSAAAAVIVAVVVANAVLTSIGQSSPVSPPDFDTQLCSDTSAPPVGWSPERAVYGGTVKPEYPVFNSVQNNPNIGDERSFVGVRPADGNAEWSQHLVVRSGHEYTVRMFVRNDAYTAGGVPGDLDALNARASFNLPTCTGKYITVWGYLASSNTYPIQVTDGVLLSGPERFNLAFVPGSAVLERNATPTTSALSEAIFTKNGVPLSSNPSHPGAVAAGDEKALYVTFRVRAQTATGP